MMGVLDDYVSQTWFEYRVGEPLHELVSTVLCQTIRTVCKMRTNPSRPSRSLLNAANTSLPFSTFAHWPADGAAEAPSRAAAARYARLGSLGAVRARAARRVDSCSSGGLSPLSKLWTAPTMRGPLPGIFVLLE